MKLGMTKYMRFHQLSFMTGSNSRKWLENIYAWSKDCDWKIDNSKWALEILKNGDGTLEIWSELLLVSKSFLKLLWWGINFKHLEFLDQEKLWDYDYWCIKSVEVLD